jgi:hypothetical protein
MDISDPANKAVKLLVSSNMSNYVVNWTRPKIKGRNSMLRKHLFMFIFILKIGTSCTIDFEQPVSGEQASPTQTTTIVPIEIHTAAASPSPSLTPTKINQPTSEADETANPAINEIDFLSEGPLLLPESWSPDGAYFAFWTINGAQMWDYMSPLPGRLAFYETATSRICNFPDILNYHSQIYNVYWQEENLVHVQDDQSAWLGAPCADSVQETASIQPDYRLLPPLLSPSGHYKVENQFYLDDNPQRARTSIQDVATGQIMNEVEYTFVESLGLGWGDHWVTESLYLVRTTSDRGPLLLDVQGNVIPVLSELFQQPITTCPECSYINCLVWSSGRATGSALDGEDIFHIAFFEKGFSDKYSNVQLYHSETGEIEEIQAKYFHSFSPDGRWLSTYNEQSYSQKDLILTARNYQVRPVDPIGSQPAWIFRSPGRIPVWSPDSQQIAAVTTEGLEIFSLSELKSLGLWKLDGRNLPVLLWSPDSQRIVGIAGILSPIPQQKDDMALFVIELD